MDSSVTDLLLQLAQKCVMNLQYLTGLVKSGALLNSPSQLGTLLGNSGGPGTLPRAVQVWTDEGGFADAVKHKAS